MATEEPEMQTIPARHGVATFVPAGQVIKIVNTSGTQVVDTWAFALPKPTPKKDQESEKKKDNEPKQDAEKAKDDKTPQTPAEESKKAEPEQTTDENVEDPPEEIPDDKPKPTRRKSKKNEVNLPSQEEAEKATQEALKADKTEKKDTKQTDSTQQKSTWSSYVPSIGWSSKNEKTQQEKDEQANNSRTWASYFPSGKGFSSYIPKNTSDKLSSFAATHNRDPSKSYLQQLQDFSKTPVGAAGLSALTGSGYGGTLYAGYAAWNAGQVPDTPAMEYMSMTHSRAMMLHMRPKVEDTLVSNLREPMLTMIEDASPGIHDTLMAACDPPRYKALGVENWEEHGSCAENLVMALKELNERAGLKGAKAVGADVTINSVPAPLNLFMNIPWNDGGDLSFDAPKTKAGDYVRLRAERDVVVIMSACPQDILDINGKNPTDAHFIVEEEQQAQTKKRVPQRRTASSQQVQRSGSQAGATTAKKPVPVRKPSGQPPKARAEENATVGAPEIAVDEEGKDDTAMPPHIAAAQKAPMKRTSAQQPADSAPNKRPSVQKEASATPAAPPKANGTASAAKKAAPKQAASTAAAQKKPPTDAAPAATPAAAPADPSGTATPRKKPRKLTSKPKNTAGQAA